MTADLSAGLPGTVVPTATSRVRDRIAMLLQLEVLRFGLVGVVNTGIDLGIYVGLHAGGLPVVIANLISTSAGLTFSYFANRAFTFTARPAGNRGRQVLLFVLCTGIGLWVLQPLAILGADRLLTAAAALAPFHILLSKVAGIAVGLVWNWTLYNRVVFRAGRR